MDASAAEENLASSTAPIGSWGSQVDLHDSERIPASEGLRDSSIISTPQLFSSSGDTAGCETSAPSGSDDVLDHESCDPTLSKVNSVNDKSSRSNSTSVTRVLIMAPVTPPRNPVAIVLIVMIILVGMSQV